MATFQANQQIDQYTLLEKIGEGGMGVVFSAQQPRMNRTVAIKFLSDEEYMEYEAGGKERFEREVQMIAQLEHPNVLPVYAFGYHEDIPYIVMRHMTGGTLSEKLKLGRMTIDEVLHLLGQVADAMDYAHEQGIVHRDLKPANIFLDDRGNAYLADFGLAKTISGSHDLTKTDEGISGTPDYMSPEQVRGIKVDGRADIYSFGIITYQALTGDPPFKGSNPMETVLKHLSEPVPPISNILPVLPEAVDTVFERILAKDPNQRYTSSANFIADLQQAVESGDKAAAEIALGKQADNMDNVHTVLGFSQDPVTLDAKKRSLAQVILPPPLSKPVTQGNDDHSTETAEPAIETEPARQSILRASIIMATVIMIMAVLSALYILNSNPYGNLPTTSFPIGQGPRTIVHNDDQLWVINNEDDTLAQVPLNCPITADSCPITLVTVASRPVALTADETYAWVGHQLDNTLMRVSIADNQIDSFPLSIQPTAWTWTGTDLWATMGKSLYQLSAEGVAQNQYPIGQFPTQLSVTGNGIWVADEGAGALVHFDPSTQISTTLPLDGASGSLMFLEEHDGTVWVSLSQAASVVLVNSESKSVQSEITDLARPNGIKISNGVAWIADSLDNIIALYDLNTQERIGEIPTDGRPTALDVIPCGGNCLDIWVATANEDAAANDSLTRYRIEEFKSP